MTIDTSKNAVEHDGEIFAPSLTYNFIDAGKIDAGDLMMPIKMPVTELSLEHGALHLSRGDLLLARTCFAEALEIGIPNSEDATSRALIHAAVMFYARPFATGARKFRLNPEFFAEAWGVLDVERHNYLRHLRDKHVAHSVNDFEDATTVGIVIVDRTSQRVRKQPSGVGVIKWSMVGLPLSRLRTCPGHIDRMLDRIDARVGELDLKIHAMVKEHIERGDAVEAAPLFRMPKRERISKSRG